MKATKKQVIDELKQLERKYEMLVWYARKTPKQIATIEGVRIEAANLEREYPNETDALRSVTTGDWHHGFNSGMLAATRFAQDALDIGIDVAYIPFPDLST
ncbi:hypothetical protein [Polynucleobacter sp. CS-Odin-A6]|uniref:hypothetical protein n=1 Tax=Polynucleobacter sp. CS-Odin-A6 TaxID=2689106 RepID=UPI001C0B17BD|nr:hypothetical protein [Polynucleobacter sp. CS-Odin-A6]MBU3621974.1 hypothetical protein [Polynucleobacter sp. CS-Odin-A6]